MQYFPRISQNSLKIPSKFRANIYIQSLTNTYLFIKYGKTAVFKGGYGRFGEILHGQICPDWV